MKDALRVVCGLQPLETIESSLKDRNTCLCVRVHVSVCVCVCVCVQWEYVQFCPALTSDECVGCSHEKEKKQQGSVCVYLAIK